MISPFPTHLFDLSPGRPYPVSVTYHGLLYPGEVIFAEEWAPLWGAVLRGHQLFRLVFLEAPLTVRAQYIQDSRIAVCLPAPGGQRREQEERLERGVLREAHARYSVPATDATLLEQERRNYASGTILTRAGVGIRPGGAFETPLPSDWIAALGESLLAWTYPQLPIDGTRFPHPLGGEEVQLLFHSLIQDVTNPESVEAVEAFGPGDCLAFQILPQELTQQGGTITSASLYERLAHVHGLPHPLATLFVLAFIRYGQPPTELHLSPEHHLRSVTGDRYPGQVVLPETVASMEFVPTLEEDSTLLRYATPASWSTLAFYFRSLDPSLQPSKEPLSQEQVPQFMAALADLQREVRDTCNALRELEEGLAGALPQQADGLLQRLANLAEASAPESALSAAQPQFTSPDGLAQAVEESRRLGGLARMKEALLSASSYLAEASVPDDLGDLSLKRRELSAVLNIGELVSSLPSATAVSMLSAGFQDDYRTAYRRHHDTYHHEMASLLSQLRDVRMEVQALQRLNGIRDLGEPLELDAPERWRQLWETLATCPVPSGEVSIGQQPLCPSCRLRLDQTPPSREAEETVRDIRAGLREQNARLSIQIVHRILDHRQSAQINRFTKLVQASDLSGLANVLDDRVERFVRGLLTQR